MVIERPSGMTDEEVFNSLTYEDVINGEMSELTTKDYFRDNDYVLSYCEEQHTITPVSVLGDKLNEIMEANWDELKEQYHCEIETPYQTITSLDQASFIFDKMEELCPDLDEEEFDTMYEEVREYLCV